jgi:hypothetical protein
MAGNAGSSLCMPPAGVDEAIQAVKDTVEGGETVPVEMREPEGSDQWGSQRRETAPKGFAGDQ